MASFASLIYFFLDDILIFGESYIREMQQVKDVLELFYMDTSTQVNKWNSTISLSMFDEEEIDFYTALFPFKRIEIDGGLK